MLFNLKNNTELANLMGVKKHTISTWKSRNTIDHALVISICEPNVIGWVFTGEGEMFRSQGVSPKDAGGEIALEDIPKECIKAWIDDFWAKADADEKAWLKIEMKKKFPEYAEWLQKKEWEETGGDSSPKGHLSKQAG